MRTHGFSYEGSSVFIREPIRLQLRAHLYFLQNWLTYQRKVINKPTATNYIHLGSILNKQNIPHYKYWRQHLL